MVKKYYVNIKKIELIEHEIEAENIEELTTVLQNYADNFEKYNECKNKKFVFNIIEKDNKEKEIELIYTIKK